MKHRLIKVAVGLVVVIAAAQFIRPDRTNPPTDASRSIQAHLGTASELMPVLNRACGDCHSNTTEWDRYTQIAPMSWVVAYAVSEGRKAVNFSEWSAYSPDRQRVLLAQSCGDASKGKMPGSIYITLRPEARLSAQDIETICAVARETKSVAAESSR